jgi:hypothetical protein
MKVVNICAIMLGCFLLVFETGKASAAGAILLGGGIVAMSLARPSPTQDKSDAKRTGR